MTGLILAVVVGLFYAANRSLALDTARRAMGRAQTVSDSALSAVAMPVGHTVEVAAAFTTGRHTVAARGRRHRKALRNCRGGLSLSAISSLLGSVRADGVGEAFLTSHPGELVPPSETQGSAAERALTDAAIRTSKQGGAGFCRLALPSSPETYLVEIAPSAPLFGERPILGVIVPEADFTDAIVEIPRRVLWTSVAVALAGVLGILALARLLSGSLARVAEEVRRIGRFDLGDFRLRAQIVEVDDLGAAVANMKNSLGSFAACVPKGVVRSILAAGGTAYVGGTAREVSLLFSDIADFTRKSGPLSPEQVTVELSRCFQAMDRPISVQGGVIDKCIGGAVMAIWNAPDDVPGHAARACRAAPGCRTAEQLLRGAGARSLFPMHTRIGLHAARVVVGNVGSAERLQYTAIGGAVNLAADGRAEQGLRHGNPGHRRHRRHRGDGFLFRPVDWVSPAGTSQPVDLYELVGENASGATHPLWPGVADEVVAWAATLAPYRAADWQGAATALAALRAETSGPGLIDPDLGRCARHIAKPPPRMGWRPHVRAEMKAPPRRHSAAAHIL